ncbi:unnamed protein product, partial [Rotaria sp. Silwood1]
LQIYHHNSILGNKNIMSKDFINELDFKIQQMKEYSLINHGYRNENIQYPVNVRRSHDGEKILSQNSSSLLSKTNRNHKKHIVSNSTILTSSSYENQTKIKQNDINNRHLLYNEHHTTLNVPPNKTINDIDPSLNCDKLYKNRKSSLTSTDSSLTYCSSRPHSIATISLPITDEQHINSLSNSSQTLINSSVSTKTLTQRFFSKFFHHPSKS